VQSNLSRSR